MDRTSTRTPRLLLVGLLWVALVLNVAGQAAADHPAEALPLTREHEQMDALVQKVRGLVYKAIDDCGDDGEEDPGSCVNHGAWNSMAAASVGIDPRLWPEPDANAAQLMLDHPAGYAEASSNPTSSLGLSITGIAAAGIDPLGVPTPNGGSRDLVRELLDEYQICCGRFNGQVVDNIWALFALNSVRHEGPEIDGVIRYLRASQGPDGSLSWNGVHVFSDVDTTAWGVAAVAPHSGSSGFADDFLDNAMQYLQDHQVTQGEWSACWINYNEKASPEATAAAINALVAMRINPAEWTVNGTHPVQCLTEIMAEKNSQATQVLMGLAWAPFGHQTGPRQTEEYVTWGPYQQETRLVIPDGFVHAGGMNEPDPGITPSTRGIQEYHGFTWSDRNPRPAIARLVVPFIPQPPELIVPDEVNRLEHFGVDAAATDAWTEHVRVDIPGAGVEKIGLGGFRAGVPGEVEVVAFAENRYGERSEATRATVTVLNHPPVLQVKGPDTAYRSRPVTLEAEVTDPEQDPVDVLWYHEGTLIGEGKRVRVSPGPPGTMDLRVQAVDSYGGVTRQEAQVEWLDSPPRVLWVKPSAARPGPIDLKADVEDPDGDELILEWWSDDRYLGSGTPLQHEFSAGRHNVSLLARTEFNETRHEHTMIVKTGILPVTLTWSSDGLQVDSDADQIRIHTWTGRPPLTLETAEPGETLRVEALDDQTVTATADVIVPPRLQDAPGNDQERPDPIPIVALGTPDELDGSDSQDEHSVERAPLAPVAMVIGVVGLALRTLMGYRRSVVG